MGTKMQYKSSLPGYHSTRDLNEDFNSCSGPLYFTDPIFPNRQSYNKISSKATADACRGSDRDVLKLTMLEHEAIFKYQVYELHRLYRIQRDLMDEVKRCRNHMAGEASFTSSPLASEEARKCGVANSSSARLSCVKDNHSSLKDDEGLVSRPRKVGRKMFDLQLPADEYIDSEDEEHFDDEGALEAQGIDLSGKPMLQLLDFQREISRNGCQNATEINGGAFPHVLEAGCSKSNEKPHVSQGLEQKEKVLISSKPMRGFCSEVNDNRAFYLVDDKWKEHQWKDGPVYDIQFSKKCHNGADSKHGEAFVSSSLLDGHQFSPFDLGKARPRSLSSWENVNWNALGGQMHPSSNTATSLHKSSDSTGYNSPLHVDRGLAKFNFSKDVSFNRVISSSVSNEAEQGSKKEKNHSMLSWLRVRPATGNEGDNPGRFSKMEEVGFTRSPMDQLPDNWNIEKVSDQNMTPNMKSGSSTCSRKLLGFPIFESKNNKSFSLTSNDGSPSRSSNGVAKDKCKAIELDINLSCDALDSEEGKHAIDLNSCFIAEDEVPARTSTSRTDKRVLAEIDLEYPAPPITEENIIPREKATEMYEGVDQQNEVVKMAAEAIVAISLVSCDHPAENAAKNLSEDSSGNLLNWFAKIVLCGRYELSEEDNGNKRSEDVDFFEMMTLRLTERNKEERIPPPLVLKDAKDEERRPTKLLNRCRKGQARRGRQQRDFQRDILPAIASLSRQKVKEDIQIFKGIMREIGHPLPSGLGRGNSKKNNCASPLSRQRTIITTPARTIVGLDDMNLKGWGKTTRRPRRQRCAGGNPHYIQGQE